MAHAKPEDLKDLALLLEQLRGIETLREKSPGCFYRKGKSVLHFHTQKGRRYAHVFDGKDWREIDLPVPQNLKTQAQNFKKISVLIHSA